MRHMPIVIPLLKSRIVVAFLLLVLMSASGLGVQEDPFLECLEQEPFMVAIHWYGDRSKPVYEVAFACREYEYRFMKAREDKTGLNQTFILEPEELKAIRDHARELLSLLPSAERESERLAQGYRLALTGPGCSYRALLLPDTKASEIVTKWQECLSAHKGVFGPIQALIQRRIRAQAEPRPAEQINH